MLERQVDICIPTSSTEAMGDSAEERRGWFADALMLAQMADSRSLYQVVGNKLLPLRIEDFDPYPSHYSESVALDHHTFSFKLLDYIKLLRTHENLEEWFRRAVTFRFRAEEMDLVLLDDKGFRHVSFDRRDPIEVEDGAKV